MNISDYPITVLDVGARYGMHPSYSGYQTELNYIAFEPDIDEARRLGEKYKGNAGYSINPLALGDKEGEVVLKILAHHGQSTILAPNNQSAWFANTRATEGNVEREEKVPMSTLDIWSAQNGVRPDFLKIDTEGYDYFVIKGATKLLNTSVMAVRCEVLFHDVYHGAPLFDDILKLLRSHGFTLGNLAYDGQGAHQSYFCPGSRWGLLTGCEAVFIKEPALMASRSAIDIIKYLIFCLKNDMPDLAYKMLVDFQDGILKTRAEFESARIYKYLEYLFLHATNKLKYIPGTNFQRAIATYETFFGKSYPDLHRFYESDHLNP